MPTLETGQARCSQGQKNDGKYKKLCATTHNAFSIDLILEGELTVWTTHWLFTAVLATSDLVKQVQRSDPIFLTSTLVMEARQLQ